MVEEAMRFVINRLFKRPAKKQGGRPRRATGAPPRTCVGCGLAGAALAVLACLGGGLVAGWQGGAFATVAGQFNNWSRMVIAQAGLRFTTFWSPAAGGPAAAT